MSTDTACMSASAAASPTPLVTFALFAYNQEKFIREAVEAAFAQTYEPLEIILSDDCSTDGTFEIMQEMAAAYRGPHRVRAVQTPRNLGVVQHVLLRGREAAGDIVVVAAGDDVSLPERVARHVPHYADPKVWAVSTGFHLIDEDGNVVSENETIPIGVQFVNKWQTYIKKPTVVIQGSTASYRKEVFDLVCFTERINFAEDNLFNFLIYASGRTVEFVQDPLILYRANINALSNLPRSGRNWHTDELRFAHQLDAEIEKMQFFLEFTRALGLDTTVDVPALEQSLIALREQKAWATLSRPTRAAFLIADLLKGRTRLLKWKLARIGGQFPDYWPKRSLAGFQRKYRMH